MPDTVTAPAPIRFTHREIMLMLSGTMCGMFLGAIDQTIVATALPAMAGELHGIEYMSWAVAAYLLTSTSSTPIYGKLSDLYGRRPLFVSAIAIFLLGSVICGAAQSMAMLIGGRAIQGLGGGGLLSLSQTIMADLVPPRERGRYQAYYSTIWSTSTLGGPMLGGFLVDVASWRWVFWINLPVALAGLLICNKQLKRLPIRGGPKKIDYLGAGLLVPGIVALLLITTWGGNEFAWTSPEILGLAVAALLLIALLIVQERRAEDPLLPLRLFGNNVFVIGNSLGFLMGAAAVGATIFLPLFMQVVIGATASNSGLLITPLMIGITFGALFTGRFIRWTGRYRIIPIVSLSIAALSFVAFIDVTRSTPVIYYVLAMTTMGLGLGPSGPMVSISVQNAVEMRDLGTATSLTSFFRSMGGSFGVAIMGAILFAGLTSQGAGAPGVSASGLLHGGPAVIQSLPENVRAVIVASFGHSFRYVYMVGAAICIVGVTLAIFMKELPLRRWGPQAQNADAAPQATREPGAVSAFAKSDSEA
ncbi:MAG TPA: MDR family MFS transporter [Stellaceae bacterium]|nr:MDR family MFS transporter [Stellaceae bacterium]